MALYLREAVEEDMDLLYEWANDAEVRKNAFHTEQIPYDTHKKWFENLLKDTETLQYILVEEETAKNITFLIGQVKYENAASARVFEKCGYKAYPQENYIEYRKQIR